MILLPLSVVCPNCGSSDVSYTCEPKCCFNHLCGNCYSTFELATVPLGMKMKESADSLPDRDCLAPTASCAVCESLNLFLVDEGQGPSERVYCAHCRALLTLKLEAIQSP